MEGQVISKGGVTMDSEGPLTEEETETLFKNIITTNFGGIGQADMNLVYEWACNAKIESILLAGVLLGRIAVCVRDGALEFRSWDSLAARN